MFCKAASRARTCSVVVPRRSSSRSRHASVTQNALKGIPDGSDDSSPDVVLSWGGPPFPQLVSLQRTPLQAIPGLSGARAPRSSAPVAGRHRSRASRTHLRSVSADIPNLPAMEVIAAHCDRCSSWCSITIRTARSRPPVGTSLVLSWLHPFKGGSLQETRSGSVSSRDARRRYRPQSPRRLAVGIRRARSSHGTVSRESQ